MAKALLSREHWLPDFSAIEVDQIGTTMDQVLQEARAKIKSLEQDSESIPSWDNCVYPLEQVFESIEWVWSPISHLSRVCDTPELRACYDEVAAQVACFYAEIGQSELLYRKYCAIRDSEQFSQLSAAQQRVITLAIQEFQLAGVALKDDEKETFLTLVQSLEKASIQFRQHCVDATDAFYFQVTDSKRLAGLPEDVIERARLCAEKKELPGWVFTLQMPSFLPVMKFARDRGLRRALYQAYVTRSSAEFSKFGGGEEAACWDNSELVVQIIKLREEKARLLGFPSYADLSVVPKMAESVQQVLDFLYDLVWRVRPFAQREITQLRQFAQQTLGIIDFSSWDIAWSSEQMRQVRYGYSEDELRAYFPQDQVLVGLFEVIHSLYGLTVRESTAPVWHEDVAFYDLCDASGAVVAQFYLDLYAREQKSSGAWMDECRVRFRWPQQMEQATVPVAYLVCNFSRGVNGKSALLTHNEVVVLFHEFGHGLHHMLTQVELYSVSGIRGVEWDAVELPSQFMENFCWDFGVLQRLSRHVETGERLPQALYQKLLGSKNFLSGMQFVRQLEFALFDLHLFHSMSIAEDGYKAVLDLVRSVRSKVAVVDYPEYERFANSFSHIFAGGYGAGYYSYKWAELLSADVFDAFEAQKQGEDIFPLVSDIGDRFRREVLAVGGTRSALESFVAFRGRKPEADPLLRHSGLAD